MAIYPASEVLYEGTAPQSLATGFTVEQDPIAIVYLNNTFTSQTSPVSPSPSPASVQSTSSLETTS